MFKGQFADTSVRRIVLCRLGGIGDVIQTLPLVKYLKKKYQEATIEYITSEDVADLLTRHCDFIDKVWVFDKNKKKQLAKEILESENKIDYFFNLHSSLSFFFFNLFYIKAKNFFQYKKKSDLHAVINFARTYDPEISMFNLESNTLCVNNSKDILSQYLLKEGRYFCFVIGVGDVRPHRAWKFENWINLAKKFLYSKKDFKVVFLGGNHEEKIFENQIKLVKDINNDRIINLLGKLSLSEVAQIISKSTGLVSCDTGLLHLASALSIRVIGLYGPTLSKRSGPFTNDYKVFEAKDCECICGFKDLKVCKKNKSSISTSSTSGFCMDSIIVSDVFEFFKCYYN